MTNLLSTMEDRRDAHMARAVRLYYLQDQTMGAIAAELHVSRSSVSRLLARARGAGIVEIKLNFPHERARSLEFALERRFAINAHVVTTAQPIAEIDRLEAVAAVAGGLLRRFVDSNMTIGVAWGATINALSLRLPSFSVHNVRVVQMNGAGNVETSGVDYAGDILNRFGSALSAEVRHFPVPAFFDDPQTREALWRERSVARVLGIRSQMDIAIFGLGSPDSQFRGHVYAGGYLDSDELQNLLSDGVTGDVATVFYREDGSSSDIPFNLRASGPDLELLRRVPRRVAVVSGAQKLRSVRGALAAGLVTDLVLDSGLACSLAEST